MLTLLGTLLTSVLSGGATGLLGIILQRFFDYKAKGQELEVIKENNRAAQVLAEMDAAKAARTAQAQEHVADADREARIAAAESDRLAREAAAAAETQTASYKADKIGYLTPGVLKSGNRWIIWAMAGIDFVRGLIRPVLTAWLVWIANDMRNQMQVLLNAYGERLPVTVVQDLLLQVMATLLYLATVSVVWWFGTRPPAQAPRSR